MGVIICVYDYVRCVINGIAYSYAANTELPPGLKSTCPLVEHFLD
jgi:hypothetical protein